MTDDTIERVTMATLFRELQSFRTEMNDKFDALGEKYPSLDAHDEMVRRVARLERETVPLATHNIECNRVITLQNDLDKLGAAIRERPSQDELKKVQEAADKARDKYDTLSQRVWLLAGGAAAVGTIASWLIPFALQHL